MIAKTTTLLAALAVSLVAFGTAAPPAAASTPCWKILINDWYDGRIDKIYAPPCYREAVKHLPTDVQAYSSAKDDILRALQDALQHKLPPPNKSPSTARGQGTVPGGTSKGPKAPGTSTNAQPPINSILNKGSGDPSSIPTPLLVLGGLALLLLAAGAAGLVAKRIQTRRQHP